jgi:hypothetical protein
MEGNEINLEVVAGMSPGQMPMADVARAVVMVARSLLEIQGRIESRSGILADGPDLTIQDIMADSRKSYATVHRWFKRGLLPRNRANRNITVRRKDYQEFKENMTS